MADLGRGRVLWLFGDFFVASTASMKFYWRAEGSGSFIPDGGGRLLLFYSILKPSGTPGPFGFADDGWTAFRKIDVPRNSWRIQVGVSVVREGGQLYLWAFDEPKHAAYLLRVSASDARDGNLAGMKWWCGEKRGWRTQERIDGRPEPVIPDASTEFSVHRDPVSGRYLQVQSVGFGGSEIALQDLPAAGIRWNRSLRLRGQGAPRTQRRGPDRHLCGQWKR